MLKNKRICIINWRDPLHPRAGGAERVTLEHALHWIKAGAEVTWISGTFHGALPSELYQGIQLHRSGSPSTLFLRSGFIITREFRNSFDLIVDEIHGFPNFSPLWSGQTPRVAFIHEVAQEIWDEMCPFPINIIGKYVEKYLFPLIYRDMPFWVDATSTKDDLSQLGIQKSHIHVIPCAITSQRKLPTKKKRTLQLIFLARLVKMKGLDLALQVFAQIRKKEPSAHLLIVGKGEEQYIQQMKKLSHQLHIDTHISFLGAVAEKKKFALLSQSHFLLHTSIREGFGLTVLEANSQGTPALVFRVAGLKEVVKNGKNGFIAQQQDVGGLAEKAVLVYRDKTRYKKLSRNSLGESKQYSWKKFTALSTRLLESCLQQRKRSL